MQLQLTVIDTYTLALEQWTSTSRRIRCVLDK